MSVRGPGDTAGEQRRETEEECARVERPRSARLGGRTTSRACTWRDARNAIYVVNALTCLDVCERRGCEL
jgi:hypothetical protein